MLRLLRLRGGGVDVPNHPADEPLPTLTYRVKQVAEMLNVPVSTLYEWVRTGVIASLRVGSGRRKLTLIPASAVDEFLNRYHQPVRPARSSKR